MDGRGRSPFQARIGVASAGHPAECGEVIVEAVGRCTSLYRARRLMGKGGGFEGSPLRFTWEPAGCIGRPFGGPGGAGCHHSRAERLADNPLIFSFSLRLQATRWGWTGTGRRSGPIPGPFGLWRACERPSRA